MYSFRYVYDISGYTEVLYHKKTVYIFLTRTNRIYIPAVFLLESVNRSVDSYHIHDSGCGANDRMPVVTPALFIPSYDKRRNGQ